MRRSLVVALAAIGLITAAVVGLRLSSQSAGDTEPAPAQPGAVPLPIAEVILFSSGVGYFEREGEVDGNARVDLSFPVTDINDLLKSLVLQDLGGGHISAVSYESQAPVEKTLRSFAINLTDNPSLRQILNQARGEKVDVVSGAGSMVGVVMGVEHRIEMSGAGAIESDILHLWCAEGMRSLKLAELTRIRFLNPVLEGEVKKALDVLAMAHDTQKKSVTLNFSGEGKRSVKVGYVVDNPIWKTSYRLVLDGQGKPYLQGWAVVENTQDEDWNNVRMALVSGRPISFQMDLYQPLFVTRPVVEPELFASLRPPTYNGALVKDHEKFLASGLNDAEAPAVNSADPVSKPASVQDNVAGLQPSSSKLPTMCSTVIAGNEVTRQNSIRRTMLSAARAAELGNFFQYRIEHPVTLPRQKSALLPIVSQEVEGQRVSIYNEQTHAKFPLLGLRFKNTSGLHLMQGPITVFDNHSYAGDARILDLQPNEERLISYAIDLGVEVEPVAHEAKEEITQVKIVKGTIVTTLKTRESKTYTIKNRTEHDRMVLLEHPYRPTYKLVKPETAEERARDVYRFKVAVAAGKTVTRNVVEENRHSSEMAVTNLDNRAVASVVAQKVASERVKAALEQAMALKAMLTAAQQEIAQNEQRLKAIREDQARIRDNLKEVPPTSEAYKRYIKKFDDQETEIEQLQEANKKLHVQADKQQKAFDDYVAELNVD
jgi:hypothetical protein